jgi:hypothetical protein
VPGRGAGQVIRAAAEAAPESVEISGYVTRQEMPGVPRETRYWLRSPGHRLISALSLLDTWYNDHEPGDDGPGAPSGGHTAGNRNYGSTPTRIPHPPAA